MYQRKTLLFALIKVSTFICKRENFRLQFPFKVPHGCPPRPEVWLHPIKQQVLWKYQSSLYIEFTVQYWNWNQWPLTSTTVTSNWVVYMGSWLHGLEVNDFYQFWNAITSNNKSRLKFSLSRKGPTNYFQPIPFQHLFSNTRLALEHVNTVPLAFHIVGNLSIFTYGDH